MRKIQVLTRWVKDGETNVPSVLSFLGPGDSAVDVTGQSVEKLMEKPDAVVWELVCSEATYNAIVADADHIILWNDQLVELQDEEGNVLVGQYEPIENDANQEKLTEQDSEEWKVEMGKREISKGTEIDAMLSEKVDLSRKEVAESLISLLKDEDNSGEEVEVGGLGFLRK